MKHPFEALMIGLRGVRTEGPMAPDISLENQRSAQYVFDGQVQQRLSAPTRRGRKPPKRRKRRRTRPERPLRPDDASRANGKAPGTLPGAFFLKIAILGN